MTRGRRWLWLGITGLLMQVGIYLVWLCFMLVSVSQLTARHPELAKLFEQVNKQQSALTVSSSDAERYFETMAPIFSQLPWPLIAVLTSLVAFVGLGYFFGRTTGSTDYLGLLPIMGLLSGQNPITLAMVFAEQGVSQARFPHWLEALLLLIQLISLYGGGLLGSRVHLRKAAAGPPLTTR